MPVRQEYAQHQQTLHDAMKAVIAREQMCNQADFIVLGIFVLPPKYGP